jgi:hypothetical protein
MRAGDCEKQAQRRAKGTGLGLGDWGLGIGTATEMAMEVQQVEMECQCRCCYHTMRLGLRLGLAPRLPLRLGLGRSEARAIHHLCRPAVLLDGPLNLLACLHSHLWLRSQHLCNEATLSVRALHPHFQWLHAMAAPVAISPPSSHCCCAVLLLPLPIAIQTWWHIISPRFLTYASHYHVAAAQEPKASSLVRRLPFSRPAIDRGMWMGMGGKECGCGCVEVAACRVCHYHCHYHCHFGAAPSKCLRPPSISLTLCLASRNSSPTAARIALSKQ